MQTVPSLRSLKTRSSILLSGLCLLLATSVLWGDGPEKTPAAQSSAESDKDIQRVSVAEARRQATLLHETYISTLHMVHRTYFDEGSRDTLPARALEDVFHQNDRDTGSRTRWISVNTPAMNIDHKPEPGFEKDAARVLATGAEEFERVEDGMYRRAGAVLLFANCTKCHLSGLRPQQGIRSVAALVISVPVTTSE